VNFKNVVEELSDFLTWFLQHFFADQKDGNILRSLVNMPTECISSCVPNWKRKSVYLIQVLFVSHLSEKNKITWIIIKNKIKQKTKTQIQIS